LQILPRYRKSVNRITAICEQFLNGPFFLSDAVNLLKSIEKVLDLLPKIPEWKNLSEVKLKNQILILVVDDDDDWREEFVLSVVKETKAELEQLGFNVTWKAFDNAEDARRAVPKQDKMRGIKNNSRPVNTIAVVDLYLPKNNREARQIKTNINDQIFNIPQIYATQVVIFRLLS
jgi:hypothetical protein